MAKVADALGMLETTGWTAAMVALDAMEKRAGIEVLQCEINDFLGVVIKIQGRVDSIEEALSVGREWAEAMGGRPIVHVIRRVEPEAWKAIESRSEYNPLIQQPVVHLPATRATVSAAEEQTVSIQNDGEIAALGFIETQGYTAVFDAIDHACKAANVEVVGKEKLGGGYVTVVIKGDVAAVKAAVEAGQERVATLGKLIAAHVIARPSKSVLSLLPGA